MSVTMKYKWFDTKRMLNKIDRAGLFTCEIQDSLDERCLRSNHFHRQTFLGNFYLVQLLGGTAKLTSFYKYSP